MQATLRNFLKLESAGGLLLILASVVAMLVANSPLARFYDLLLDVPVEVRIGALHIAKPLILWINDGLMAIFFFAIGLELKRELLEGELSRPANVLLPALGAIGGIVVPVGNLRRIQSRGSGGPARLGDSGSHRHRVRTRHTAAARQARTRVAQGVSGVARHLRRRRRDRDHRDLLHRPICPCSHWPSREPASSCSR